MQQICVLVGKLKEFERVHQMCVLVGRLKECIRCVYWLIG